MGHKFLVRLLWALPIVGLIGVLAVVWIGLGWLAAVGALVLISVVLFTFWRLGPVSDDPVLEEMTEKARAWNKAGGFKVSPD